jgi:osmotically-inducible protein OsmY
MTTSSAHLVGDLARWPADPDLQRLVEEELHWSQGTDASHIGVSVDHGVVHLDGTVRDAAQDADVRRAVRRVRGIVGIVDGLRTRPPRPMDDAVLLSNTVHALRFAAGVPSDVQASVHDGVVTLTGSTTWHAQREAACRTVERLAGCARSGTASSSRRGRRRRTPSSESAGPSSGTPPSTRTRWSSG